MSVELRLSAVRAFLGRVHPSMRLIKIKRDRDRIIVTVIVEYEPNASIREDVSEAAAEIVADFEAPATIQEVLQVSAKTISNEDIFTEGWIYRRAE